MRNGDVAADIAVLAQMRRELDEFFRRHGFTAILCVEVVFLGPIIVDQRRARMTRWPCHDARHFFCSFTLVAHESTAKSPTNARSIYSALAAASTPGNLPHHLRHP